MTLISSMATGTYAITRSSAGGYNANGDYVPGATSSINVVACVQPMSDNERLLLPEGRRTRENINIFTDVKLQTSDEKNSIKADLIAYEGVNYEVWRVQKWPGTDIPHYKSVASKIDGEGNG